MPSTDYTPLNPHVPFTHQTSSTDLMPFTHHMPLTHRMSPIDGMPFNLRVPSTDHMLVSHPPLITCHSHITRHSLINNVIH